MNFLAKGIFEDTFWRWQPNTKPHKYCTYGKSRWEGGTCSGRALITKNMVTIDTGDLWICHSVSDQPASTSATVFHRINAPGTEAENELCLIAMRFALWTPQYLNYKCWKYHSDWIISFWDIASQSQKSGGTFIQAGTFIRWNMVCISMRISQVLFMTCSAVLRYMKLMEKILAPLVLHEITGEIRGPDITGI